MTENELLRAENAELWARIAELEDLLDDAESDLFYSSIADTEVVSCGEAWEM